MINYLQSITLLNVLMLTQNQAFQQLLFIGKVL